MRALHTRRMDLPMVSSALDESLSDITRRPVMSAGAPLNVSSSPQRPRLGTFLVCDTSASNVTVFLPEIDGSRLGDKVSVANSGSGTVTVIPPPGYEISGASQHALTSSGEAFMYFATAQKKYTRFGAATAAAASETPPPHWPQFIRDPSDVSLVTAHNAGTYNVRMEDGTYWTADSGDCNCDISSTGIGGRAQTGASTYESASSGIWHLYAVPNGDVFGIVMSQSSTPESSGPSYYSTYRYLWSILASTSSLISEFVQDRDKYYVTGTSLNSNTAFNTLDISATPSTGSWISLTSSSSGTGYTVRGLANIFDMSIVGAIGFGVVTYISTASDDLRVAVESGTGTKPTPADVNNAFGVKNSSGDTYDLNVSHFERAIREDSLYFYVKNATGSTVANMQARWYTNKLWGVP